MRRKTMPQQQGKIDRPSIVISANAFWNIENFRASLIDGLIARDYRIVVACPDASREWASLHGAESVAIEVDRSGLNLFRDAKLFFSYVNILRDYVPEFFLGYTVKPNIYGCLAARLRGIPAIPNVSGLGTAFINPGPLSALVGALYRLAFGRCPIVFFQNSDDRDLFVKRKIVRPDQARILPGSGVDLVRFAPTSAKPAAEVRFLFVGRILGDKGVREFVEAARSLRRDYPAWKFELLGPIDEGNRSGIGQADLDRWVRDGSIAYLGHADDVRPHIGKSTAVVLPSYREGLPRSLLEAAAMARPLIASDVPGNRQIVEHGVNGLLCAARDHNSLAEAMLQMGLMETDRREAMGRAGRAKVERGFGEQQVIQAYLDAIAQLHIARGR